MTAPLIPRTQLFGNPTRAQGQISPDGRWLSWLAPRDGVLNIWVAPAGDIGAARVVTDDRQRGIRLHAWANTSAHLLYIQDEGGTEDWHIYAVPVAGGPTRDLTPIPGVNARIQAGSLDEPDTLVIGLNDRDKAWHDSTASTSPAASASCCSRTGASWPGSSWTASSSRAWLSSRATAKADKSSTASRAPTWKS